MDGQTFWAAVGAIGQIITACMSVVVAYMAVRFTKRQTSITLLTSLNSLWNSYSVVMIENPEAREVFGKYKKEIIGHTDDYVIDMVLNIYETSFLLYAEGLVPASYYEAMLENILHTLVNVPDAALSKYLRRGYDPNFVKDIEQRIAKRVR